jgi:hypothetical protein
MNNDSKAGFDSNWQLSQFFKVIFYLVCKLERSSILEEYSTMKKWYILKKESV